MPCLMLAESGSGWYLAPLRLLAREMFEKINMMGVPCNLLTGEERIDVPWCANHCGNGGNVQLGGKR